MDCVEYSCSQCNKVFNGPVPYLSHIKSEKHRQKASGMDEPNAVTRRSVAACIESTASGPASGPLQALMRRSRPYSFCELCKVALNSETAVDIHNKGKKHLQKLKNEGYRRLIMAGSEREATATSSLPGPGVLEGASPSSTEHWYPCETPSSSTSLITAQGAESTSSPDWNPSALEVTSSSSIVRTKRGPESTLPRDWIPSTQQSNKDLPTHHRGPDLSCEPCGIVLFKSLEYKLEHISTIAHQRKQSQAVGFQRSRKDWAPWLIEGLTITEYERQQRRPGISSRGWSHAGEEEDDDW